MNISNINLIPPEGLTIQQQTWMEYRFGIRFTFGINTFYNTETSDGSLNPSIIELKELEIDNWVETAINAGMKYCIFTAKNHDGFCNWNTEYSYYNIINTPFNQDLLELLAASCEKYGLKLGLYYSLLDSYSSYFNDDERYAAMILDQLEELLTKYGNIVEIWFDGYWGKQINGWNLSPNEFVLAWRSEGAFRFKIDYIYHKIKEFQPDCIVLNHSTNEFIGVPLHPVDARTGIDVSYVVVDRKYWNWLGSEKYIPWEITVNLSGKDYGRFESGNWYWHEGDESGPEKNTVKKWLQFAKKHDTNLVLNCSISPLGKMREVDQILLDRLWKEDTNIDN